MVRLNGQKSGSVQLKSSFSRQTPRTRRHHVCVTRQTGSGMDLRCQLRSAAAGKALRNQCLSGLVLLNSEGLTIRPRASRAAFVFDSSCPAQISESPQRGFLNLLSVTTLASGLPRILNTPTLLPIFRSGRFYICDKSMSESQVQARFLVCLLKRE